jgi:excisionase family DNA binding protein
MTRLLVLADSPEAFRELLRATIAELLPVALPTTTNPSADALLTTAEACREFGISKTTLSEWKKKGIVPFVRLGRRIYFERDKVLAAGRARVRP